MKHRKPSGSRLGKLILIAVTVLAAVLITQDQARGAASVSGSPDVTGAGSTFGSVSLSQLRQQAPGATVTATELTYDGIRRGYLVVAPAVDSGPLTLLVGLHGSSASPTQEVLRDEFLPLVSQGRAVLLYPAGYGESWNVNAQGCCEAAAAIGTDDVGFVTHAITTVRAAYPVRSTDLVGFSNGGKLAFDLMCQRPDVVDAVAAVAAVPLTDCPTAAPKPVLMSVGSTDPKLPIDQHPVAAGVALATAEASWRARNGCAATSSTVVIALASRQTWQSCSSGDPVVGITYTGLGHNWPTKASVGAADSGATLIWSFFAGLSPAS